MERLAFPYLFILKTYSTVWTSLQNRTIDVSFWTIRTHTSRYCRKSKDPKNLGKTRGYRSRCILPERGRKPNSAKQCWLLKTTSWGNLLPRTLTRGSLSMMPDRDDVMCGWRLGPQREIVRERNSFVEEADLGLASRFFLWMAFIYIHIGSCDG